VKPMANVLDLSEQELERLLAEKRLAQEQDIVSGVGGGKIKLMLLVLLIPASLQLDQLCR